LRRLPPLDTFTYLSSRLKLIGARQSLFIGDTFCPRPLHPSTSTAFHCGKSSLRGARRTHLTMPDLSIHHGLMASFCFDKRPYSSLNCYGDDPRHGCLMSAAIRHTSFDCFDTCPYTSVNTAPCCVCYALNVLYYSHLLYVYEPSGLLSLCISHRLRLHV